MLRGIWGDRHRYQSTYWNHFDGMYFAGDGAKKDVDGDLWLLGRVDDVMNVSGHRLTTTEIEHSLVSHPWVAEAAVVGANDEITGQAVVAFVIVRSDAAGGPDDGVAVTTALREHVRKQIARHPGGGRGPQDSFRQDHATAAARRRRAPPGGRRHHAGRLLRDGRHQGRPSRR